MGKCFHRLYIESPWTNGELSATYSARDVLILVGFVGVSILQVPSGDQRHRSKDSVLAGPDRSITISSVHIPSSRHGQYGIQGLFWGPCINTISFLLPHLATLLGGTVGIRISVKHRAQCPVVIL